MGFAVGVALSGIVLSAVVRTRYPDVMGSSVLLLVSVRLGDCGFRTNGHRVLQAEDLTDTASLADPAGTGLIITI